MPNRNTRRHRRGRNSRLRHNRRRSELYRELVARQASTTPEVVIDLTLEEDDDFTVELTLGPPAAILDSTPDEVDPVVIDLTTPEFPSPRPSTSRYSPLSLSYSPISQTSPHTPQPIRPRRLSFSSDLDTPDHYPSLRSPSSEQGLSDHGGVGVNDVEWDLVPVEETFPDHFLIHHHDQFPGEPLVPPGEPVPEEYYTFNFRSFYLREE